MLVDDCKDEIAETFDPPMKKGKNLLFFCFFFLFVFFLSWGGGGVEV